MTLVTIQHAVVIVVVVVAVVVINDMIVRLIQLFIFFSTSLSVVVHCCMYVCVYVWGAGDVCDFGRFKLFFVWGGGMI